VIKAVKKALEEYEQEHPTARVDLYRQNNVSIRIRIVDPAFKRISKGDRHDRVWAFLAERLDDRALAELSVLLLLTPAEQANSFMNSEFEDPIKSSF